MYQAAVIYEHMFDSTPDIAKDLRFIFNHSDLHIYEHMFDIEQDNGGL